MQDSRENRMEEAVWNLAERSHKLAHLGALPVWIHHLILGGRLFILLYFFVYLFRVGYSAHLESGRGPTMWEKVEEW